MDLTVMSLTAISRGFPSIPVAEVVRDNFLDTIDSIFLDRPIVTVEGPEGIGKTTLLAQYARRSPDTSISLFIQPLSRLSYAADYIRLVLLEQIHWILAKAPLLAETIHDTELATQIPILQKRALRGKTSFTFVIDGLEDIPVDDVRSLETILRDILPLGFSGFRFLLSGDLTRLSSVFGKSLPAKSFPLPPFSLDDTIKYLADLQRDTQAVEDLRRLCKGVPGHLAVVRRLLLTGTSVDQLLDEDLSGLPDFLAVEWNSLRAAPPDERLLLAIVAFGRKPYTLRELAAIAGRTTEDVHALVHRASVLTVEPPSGSVTFVSNAHRQYAVRALRDNRDAATDLIIQNLLRSADPDLPLVELPAYLEQAGRLPELLEYLTPDHFSRLLDKSQSLAAVHRRADLGLRTAKKVYREEDIFKFSLHKAILSALDAAAVWRSEIEARMSLGDSSAALALAHSVKAREDRLQLLAAVARRQAEAGAPVDPALQEQITLLIGQVDLTSIADHAVDIASDLTSFDPDLAIRVVEQATATENDPNALDRALTGLSFATLDSTTPRPLSRSVFEITSSKVKDPATKAFLSAVSLVVGHSSPTEVIQRVSRIDPKNRVFLLRQWALMNADTADATEVLQYALDLLVRESTATPTTRELREIATPLKSIQDADTLRHLIGRIDSLKGSIEHLGTTTDFVQLQILVASAQRRFDQEGAVNRLLETYLRVSDLSDLGLRLECLAWLLASIEEIDPGRELETQQQIHTKLPQDFSAATELLLTTVASQFDVAAPALRALAGTRPRLAVALAERLNTQVRRDNAFTLIITEIASRQPDGLDADLLLTLLARIHDRDFRDSALFHAFLDLVPVLTRSPAASTERLLPLFGQVEHMASAELRCRTCCLALRALTTHPELASHPLASHLLSVLSDSWDAVDRGWRKIDIGFRIVKELAPSDHERALAYLARTEHHQEEMPFDAAQPTAAYIMCVLLALRAYTGLLPRGIAVEADLERLRSLITRLPGLADQITLWSDLAVRLHINGHSTRCSEIVTQYVRPLIAALHPADESHRWAVVRSAAPALFFSHRAAAYQIIDILPDSDRNVAYDGICRVIFRRQPRSEPYRAGFDEEYRLSYEEALDVCEILHRLTLDALIYGNVHTLACSLTARINKDSFTLQQRTEIADRLEALVKAKLPDANNIRHPGYRVAAFVQIAKLRRSSDAVLAGLRSEAEALPNVADKAMVLSYIAAANLREKARRDEVLRVARTNLDSIPAELDRMGRLIDLAEIIMASDSAVARAALSASMTVACRREDESVAAYQRRILDAAHQIDPHFAASLASSIDDDPARLHARNLANKHLELLNTKQ